MHDATQRDNLYPFRNIYNVYKPTQTTVLRGFSFRVKKSEGCVGCKESLLTRLYAL